MNRVLLLGRLARDPEAFANNTGTERSRISLAINERSGGEEKTHFIPCIAWGKTANYINTYVTKGDMVAIEARLTRNSYVNKEGKKVESTEVVIDRIDSISSKKKDSPKLVNVNESFNSSEPTIIKNETKEEDRKDEEIEDDDIKAFTN